MKPNRFERDYKDTPAPIAGIEREFSNKTKLARTQGKININCDLCGLLYETYACWAKRTSNHYCSKACANAAKEIPVEKFCVICGGTFIANPTTAKKLTTCSRKCLKVNRSRLLTAEAENMSKSPIFNYGNHERGEQISRNLSDDDVRAIRADTRPQTQIADQYGISQSNVSQIKTRATWAHVSDDEPPNVELRGRAAGEGPVERGGTNLSAGLGGADIGDSK